MEPNKVSPYWMYIHAYTCVLSHVKYVLWKEEMRYYKYKQGQKQGPGLLRGVI